MIQRITIEGMNLDDFLHQFRLIVKDELQKQNEALAKERLISGDVARKLFDPVISKQTMHRWTKEGLIHSYRIGGRIYYKETEVIESAKKTSKYGR